MEMRGAAGTGRITNSETLNDHVHELYKKLELSPVH